VGLFKAITAYGVSLDKDGVGGINYLSYDFASHLEYKFNKKKDTNSYKAFSHTELQNIINGHVYQQDKNNKRKSDDFIFWAPLLGMYTGARVNEIAQLLTDDIKQEAGSGIWYINILDDEQAQSANNLITLKRLEQCALDVFFASIAHSSAKAVVICLSFFSSRKWKN